MLRKLCIGIVSGIIAMSVHAETTRVLRFVPLAGSESEVAINSLQKVVFTPDSIVLIAATNGEATPMYKYDYQSILFATGEIPSDIETIFESANHQIFKFIKDGQLFIRLDEQVYNIFGNKIQ